MSTKTIYQAILPSQSTAERQRNAAVHLGALSATKTADGLIDPKLILSWLLSAVGAPGYLVGALVPVRESGALLPQLGLAPLVQETTQRSWVWAAGSALQGLAALAIAASVLLLDGAAAGWAVLVSLAVLAVARSACSASYKDVLARTVDKGARGTVTGIAGSVAAAAVLVFAILLSMGIIPLEIPVIAATVTLAGAFWLLAAAMFTRLREPEAAKKPIAALNRIVAPLREDPEFRTYLLTRALLIPTALAPPFIVLLSQVNAETGLGNLGALLIGSSTAAILSSFVWGRLSDQSSRRTLAASACIAALTLAATAMTGFVTGGIGPAWLAAIFVFAAQIAYHGVRAGRSTHLADMDTGEQKPLYTALSNTTIGILLLAGGGFGLLADVAGPAPVLAIFAAISAAAIIPATSLSEVQQED